MRHFSLLCLFPLLWGCASEDHLAGNSVETESGGIRILRIDSILPAWNRAADGASVATLRFDSANFNFSSATADGRDLRLKRPDSSDVPFNIAVWDSSARIGRLHVRIDSQLATETAVQLRWSGNQDTVSTADSAATWSGISDAQQLSANSVQVDDFESGNDTTCLPTTTIWRASAGDSATVNSLVYGSDRNGGRAIHLSYTTSGTHYALIQTALVSGGASRSLRSLDSLVVWARGTGGVWFTFEHLVNGTGPKSWVHKTLDTGWTRFCIRPSDLLPADTTSGSTTSNHGWEAVRDSVNTLTFIAVSGTDLWLDDIRLHGINRGDLQ